MSGMRYSGALAGDPVTIVGGGAGGLAAAVALADRGIASRVFERTAIHTEIDRGDIIHFASQRLLRCWDAWDHITARGARAFTRFEILNGDGRKMLQMETGSLLGSQYHLTALRHPDIVAALRSKAQDTGLVEIHDSEPVQELLIERDRIIGVRTARATYPAPLTVLATGSRSKLRDEHFGVPDEVDYDRSFFNARLKALDNYQNCGYYVLDRAGILIMVSLPGDELRMGIQFVTSDRAGRPTEDNFAEHAARILRPLANEQLTLIEAHTYRLRSILADRWHVPGGVLLGDTAHTVHPTGGQGMNLAFGDAEALAGRVVDAMTTADLDAACAGYAQVRRQQVVPVYRRARLGGRAAGITRPVAVAARAGAVRALDRLTPLKRAVFSRIVDIR